MRRLILISLCLGVFSVFSDPFGGDSKTTYSLPAWQDLDTPDRHYESDIVCSFTPTITGDAGKTVLYPAVDAGGTIIGKLPTYRSFETVRQALVENCQTCINDLDRAKRDLMDKNGIRFMEERCYLRSCRTKQGRLIGMDSGFFNSVLSDGPFNREKTYCQFLRPQYHEKPKANREMFKAYNLYSRPNDDTFQNLSGKGGKGEPFEVALVHCGIIAEKNPETGALDLSVDWRAEMATGRHVEAGFHFLLREARCSMYGEMEATQPGDRKPEKNINVSIHYPFGSNKDSSAQAKVGSVMGAKLPLGSIVEDGNYTGELEIRTIKSCRLENEHANSNGMMQAEGIAGPKEGIFQRIPWKMTVQDGKVTKADIKCERTNEKLRLVYSNYKPVDHRRPEHQNYIPQPPFAPCKQETVGGGDLNENDTQAEKLGKEVGMMIQKSGCLDCHGEGNADLFRFCDTGVSVRPKDDGPKILSMMMKGMPTRTSGKPYPKGMERALENLKKLDANATLVKKWVDAN